jgi:hypothetical protein
VCACACCVLYPGSRNLYITALVSSAFASNFALLSFRPTVAQVVVQLQVLARYRKKPKKPACTGGTCGYCGTVLGCAGNCGKAGVASVLGCAPKDGPAIIWPGFVRGACLLPSKPFGVASLVDASPRVSSSNPGVRGI